MFQEIHFKLMNRIQQKRMLMADSNMVLCPRIKKKLDEAVTQSREWQAVWDGNRKFQVKSGTRALTVDLLARSCDCRVFNLTGIPCEHVVACIHERRQNPIDYVSSYYKREKYLESYKLSLEPIRGSEYWELSSTDPLLPPDIPKKLRGRPKKLRRREEWEGGRASQSQAQVAVKQRYNAGRVIHCSICKQPGHKKQTCPNKPTQEGENATEGHGANEDGGNETVAIEPVRRAKLPVRRTNAGKGKMKGKATSAENTMKIATQASQTNVVKEKMTTVKEKEIKNAAQGTNNAADVWCLKGPVQASFMEHLRGDLGKEALFMPTPGFHIFRPTCGTPSADTPPTKQHDFSMETMRAGGAGQTKSEGVQAKVKTKKELRPTVSEPRRKSVRLMTRNLGNFTNTEETTISLDDDNL